MKKIWEEGYQGMCNLRFAALVFGAHRIWMEEGWKNAPPARATRLNQCQSQAMKCLRLTMALCAA